MILHHGGRRRHGERRNHERRNQTNNVRTASGPGSPRGQPAWGGGCDRIIDAICDARHKPVATARGSDTRFLVASKADRKESSFLNRAFSATFAPLREMFCRHLLSKRYR